VHYQMSCLTEAAGQKNKSYRSDLAEDTWDTFPAHTWCNSWRRLSLVCRLLFFLVGPHVEVKPGRPGRRLLLSFLALSRCRLRRRDRVLRARAALLLWAIESWGYKKTAGAADGLQTDCVCQWHGTLHSKVGTA